jgi:AraC family transcriptional regulator of arabinose operon
MNIFSVGSSAYTSSFHIDRRDGLKAHLIRFQMEGICQAILNEVSFTLNPGDLFFARYGDQYELKIGGRQGKTSLPSTDYYFMVHPDDVWFAEWWSQVEPQTKRHIGYDERLIALWKQISYEKRRLRDSDQTIMDYLARAFLLHLKRLIQSTPDTYSQKRLIAYQMKEFIELNCSQPLTLRQIAGSVGLSISRASELFKQTFNQSVMNYYIEAKLMLAKERIHIGGTTLEEIAYECGFSTYSHFNRSFRSRFGISPSHYKGQSRKK